MRIRTLVATTLLAVAALAQDPAPKGVRLVYDIPAEALQQALPAAGERTPDDVLREIVDHAQRRLGKVATVARGAGVTFTVDVADDIDPETVKHRFDALGNFETRVLADLDYFNDDVRFDLGAERRMLQSWLDDGGRERVCADPLAIAGYRADGQNDEEETAHLRWYPHRIVPDARRPGRWSTALCQILGPNPPALATWSEEDWNDGEIPQHILARPESERFLVELIAINMHERCFTGDDLDLDGLKVQPDGNGGTGLAYRFTAARARDYAGWTTTYLNKFVALVWDGEVMLVPRIVAPIRGVGLITGLAPAQAESMAAALKSPFVVRPRLLRVEAR